MKVMFATAELSPLIKVGGLADAASGLAKALTSSGVDVEVVVPNYGDWETNGEPDRLEVPEWVGQATAAQMDVSGFGPVTAISTPSLARPHPYTDETGKGFPDNDERFFGFSAAIARLVELRNPDVLHIHDWHTASTLGYLRQTVPAVFTIHNPAYQGTTFGQWLQTFSYRPNAFEWYGNTNPLTGAIALADAVTTVSPTFAREMLDGHHDFGLEGPLRARGDRFSGIINGLDTSVWDPATDEYLSIRYDSSGGGAKRKIARELVSDMGWDLGTQPLIGFVTRLTDQKGVDIALQVAQHLEEIPARMILLGSGDASLAAHARHIASQTPDRFVFHDAYDEGLAHRIFAASDIYLVPSKFEPCGLTQMQAMAYGSIPVATPVGGLCDTVFDEDAVPGSGTGFMSGEVDAHSFFDALQRAARTWRSTKKRGQMRRRIMEIDWSWSNSADRYLDLYQDLM